jgi:hypothetical protein
VSLTWQATFASPHEYRDSLCAPIHMSWRAPVRYVEVDAASKATRPSLQVQRGPGTCGVAGSDWHAWGAQALISAAVFVGWCEVEALRAFSDEARGGDAAGPGGRRRGRAPEGFHALSGSDGEVGRGEVGRGGVVGIGPLSYGGPVGYDSDETYRGSDGGGASSGFESADSEVPGSVSSGGSRRRTSSTGSRGRPTRTGNHHDQHEFEHDAEGWDRDWPLGPVALPEPWRGLYTRPLFHHNPSFS